ncbi:hypothetical protein QBC41DRAFT_340224 [Cercophora samala]|uniref:2EXR domain-containing protein n=1 Tax=Cercophora samala TaxID=330535 RepID=A0AA39Z5M4_9PEZI|nr:hypothetical protein QBC41DRAFT_340224 [Cercophora samala]
MSTSDSDTDPFPPTPAAAPPPNNNHLLTPPTHEPPLLLTWEQLLDRFTHQVHRLSTEQTTSHRRLESALLSQLSAIKRDLSRQLSREVSGLRSQLLLADQPPKFSLFRRLPVEVRVRVWEFALWACPRVLEIRAGLQSPSAALSIAHLFNESTPPHQVWTTHHASLLSKSPFASPLLNNTTFRLEGWEISWLIQRYKLFPLTFPLAEIVDTEDLLFYDGEVTRAENGWVREELRRMPEIRLLHAFILDEFNDEGGGYQGEKGVEVRRLYGGGFGGRLGTLGVV